jgi:membrane protein
MSAIQASEEPTSRDDAKRTFQKMPIVELGKRTAKEFMDDEVPELAAGVAYHAIFAIPPMIIFIVTLAALVDQVTSVGVADRLRDLVAERAPADTQELLTGLVDSAIAGVSGGVASLGVAISALVALWSGSNGVSTIIRAFNRAYDVDEDRPFVKKKLVSIGLTVLMGVLIILAFTMFVFGGQIGTWVADQVGLGSAFEVTWNILRWPLAIIFIMFMLAVLYYLGPNIEQSFHWISPGSVVATLLWIAIVFGFKFYVSIADPGSAYGAVGGIVVLLFFLYLSGIAFLVGAEVNAVLQRRYDEKTIRDLAENPEKAKNTDARVENIENARDFDRREGTAAASAAVSNAEPHLTNVRARAAATSAATPATKPVRTAAPPRARSANQPAIDDDSPGLGKQAATFVGTLVAAFAVSKLRRGKERN